MLEVALICSPLNGNLLCFRLPFSVAIISLEKRCQEAIPTKAVKAIGLLNGERLREHVNGTHLTAEGLVNVTFRTATDEAAIEVVVC